MAADPRALDPFIHYRVNVLLIVSRCAQCGLVVAASPRLSILRLMERMHVCPVYQNYSVSNK